MHTNQMGGDHGRKAAAPPGQAPPRDQRRFLAAGGFVLLCCFELSAADWCVVSLLTDLTESAREESAAFPVVSRTIPVSIPGFGIDGVGAKVVDVSPGSRPAAVSVFDVREEHAPIATASAAAVNTFHLPVIRTSSRSLRRSPRSTGKRARRVRSHPPNPVGSRDSRLDSTRQPRGVMRLAYL